MTFKRRYLAEETGQTIENKIDNAAKDYTKLNDAKPENQTPSGISDVAVASTASATVPLIRSVENINDVQGNRTPNDANTSSEALARESRKAVQSSSRTPFNVTITESSEGQDPMARFRGPHHNKLKNKLTQAGLNTGFDLKRVAPRNSKSEASMAGQKNINSGTNAVIKNTKKIAGQHAAANVNIPHKNDIKKATTLTDSIYFGVSLKIDTLLEYTDMDVKWGTNAPGNVKSGRAMHGLSNTHDRTSDTHDMVKNMNDVIDDKQKVQAKNRAATMPEKENGPEHGNIMTSRNIVHGSDQANAEVRQQRESRLTDAAEGEQDG